MPVAEAQSGGRGFSRPDPPSAPMPSPLLCECWLPFVNQLRGVEPRARDLQRSVLWTECLSPRQVPMLHPNAPCDGIRRWGLWE